MAFFLTKSSVILCPHGGRVTHSPRSFSGKLINGEIPMLSNDTYLVVGCPVVPGGYAGPCHRVSWTGGSRTRQINGSPVLTNQSVGICLSAVGAPQGPAVISRYQTREAD